MCSIPKCSSNDSQFLTSRTPSQSKPCEFLTRLTPCSKVVHHNRKCEIGYHRTMANNAYRKVESRFGTYTGHNNGVLLCRVHLAKLMRSSSQRASSTVFTCRASRANIFYSLLNVRNAVGKMQISIFNPRQWRGIPRMNSAEPRTRLSNSSEASEVSASCLISAGANSRLPPSTGMLPKDIGGSLDIERVSP